MIPKLAYIKWKDACFGLTETPYEKTTLVDLHAIGFVLREDDESITISLEWQDGADTTRNWIAIPKNRIYERRNFAIPKARKPAGVLRQGGPADDVPNL